MIGQPKERSLLVIIQVESTENEITLCQSLKNGEILRHFTKTIQSEILFYIM